MADYETPVLCAEGGRKARKTPRPNNKKTNSDNGQLPTISCTHGLSLDSDKKHKRSMCKVADLSHCDMVHFRDRFYSNKTKILQDCFLLKYMKAKVPVRRTVKNPKNQRGVTVSYFIWVAEGTVVPVCAATFQSILGISRARLQRLAKNHVITGNMPKEKRGGHRLKEKHDDMTRIIKRNILKYKCRETHYSRKDSSRSYLAPELNLTKMWQRYCEECQRGGLAKCSLSKYKSVFYKNFNLGFGNPLTDTCSICAEYQIKIKATNDLEAKNDLRTKSRLHNMKAKKFFQILKEEKEDTVNVCFDCQQNQPLPKLSIGEVFYSRQVWLYNCLFMQVANNKNTNMAHYTWLETQSGRGANAIASAIRHYLLELEKDLKKQKKKVILRLFSDSCGSQNKNFVMMATLMRIAERSSVFIKILHYYPIRGHSYMPPDRVFGHIEKDYRKMETITTPSQYYSVLNKFGRCVILGQDWKLIDLKSKASEIVKKKLPVKMQEVRVFEYTKKQVKIRTAYSAEGIEVKPLKEGVKTLSLLDKAPEIILKNRVSEKKANDIRKLMAFFDYSSEEAQAFYESVFKDCQKKDNDNVTARYFDESSVSI